MLTNYPKIQISSIPEAIKIKECRNLSTSNFLTVGCTLLYCIASLNIPPKVYVEWKHVNRFIISYPWQRMATLERFLTLGTWHMHYRWGEKNNSYDFYIFRQ